MKQTLENCFAVAAPGLEQVCAAELTRLGLTGLQPAGGGVAFSASRRDLWRANLWLRSASRILVRLGEFRCRDFPALFQQTVRLPWGRYLRPDDPLQVRASCHGSRLNHTGRIAETLTAAIGRALGGGEPAAGRPIQTVMARFEEDRCQLSIDSSGALLHRRGYRAEQGAAPLRETLAAGILMLLGWDGREPLLDPCCGSGTVAIEAALLASGLAPGRQRDFAFMHWPHWRPGGWQQLLAEAEREAGPPAVTISGSDSAGGLIDIARRNAERAGVATCCRFDRRDLFDPWPSVAGPPGLLLANPPYGERLGEPAELVTLYRRLGELLQGPFAGWRGALLTSRPELAAAAGLHARPVALLPHGGLQVQLLELAATG